MTRHFISRRTVLRGLGVGMSLPLLDAMIPIGLTAGAAVEPPLRLELDLLSQRHGSRGLVPDRRGTRL
jgi:hypothetical protein